MKNWICYQIAMYYLRKAHKVEVYNLDLWAKYLTESALWIAKVKP